MRYNVNGVGFSEMMILGIEHPILFKIVCFVIIHSLVSSKIVLTLIRRKVLWNNEGSFLNNYG